MTATFAREYRTWLMQWKQAAKARPSLFHFSEYSYAGKMSFTGLHKQAKRMLDKAYDDEIFPCILFRDSGMKMRDLWDKKVKDEFCERFIYIKEFG